jgi:hypothetical protein
MKARYEEPRPDEVLEAPDAGGDQAARLLDQIQPAPASAEVTLASGRRYEMTAGEAGDQLTVRSRGGEIVLRIVVTDAGPVLSFSGASIDIAATQRLRLEGEEVLVRASGNVAIEAGGSLRERVGGDHHTSVAGDERLEASGVEVQASTGSVAVRAMGKIALDGETIGLNDDPLPQPFPWSGIADEP